MKKVYKKYFNFLLNKSYWGSLFLAGILWVYASLERQYSPSIKIPLKVTLPGNRALLNEIPDSIEIVFSGKGWNLFSQLYMQKNDTCKVNLKNEHIYDSVYYLSGGKIISSLHLPASIKGASVNQKDLSLVTNKIIEKEVIVKSNITILPRNGYRVSGDVNLQPKTIVIKGNEKLINDIENWGTEKLRILDAYKPISGTIALADTTNERVSPIDKYVYYKIDIQQTVDKSFYDIPIQVGNSNYKLSKNIKLYPSRITVTVYGSIDKIKEIEISDVVAKLFPSEVNNNNSGIAVPHISLPKGIGLLSIEPKFIEIIQENYKD